MICHILTILIVALPLAAAAEVTSQVFDLPAGGLIRMMSRSAPMASADTPPNAMESWGGRDRAGCTLFRRISPRRDHRTGWRALGHRERDQRDRPGSGQPGGEMMPQPATRSNRQDLRRPATLRYAAWVGGCLPDFGGGPITVR
jgi:hypothetical protein